MVDTVHYIYVIRNRLNGKSYVGQTVNPAGRWSSHKKEATRSQGRNFPIYLALRKYGPQSFEFKVIAVHRTQISVDAAERAWIERFDSANPSCGYNVQPGGVGLAGSLHPLFGTKRSEETRRKISEAKRGQKYPPRTADHAARLSDAKRGKRRSAEQRARIAAAHKGQIPWIAGKKHTEETRRKMSESAKLRWARTDFEG